MPGAGARGDPAQAAPRHETGAALWGVGSSRLPAGRTAEVAGLRWPGWGTWVWRRRGTGTLPLRLGRRARPAAIGPSARGTRDVAGPAAAGQRDWRNQCCRRGVRGLHRPRPSRTANAAGAPCAATACGSLGRGHGWQRPRGCCGRAHGLADRPRANCRRAGCPRNLLWNWRRDQRAPFTKAKRESAEYPVKSRFHTLTFVTPSEATKFH